MKIKDDKLDLNEYLIIENDKAARLGQVWGEGDMKTLYEHFFSRISNLETVELSYSNIRKIETLNSDEIYVPRFFNGNYPKTMVTMENINKRLRKNMVNYLNKLLAQYKELNKATRRDKSNVSFDKTLDAKLTKENNEIIKSLMSIYDYDRNSTIHVKEIIKKEIDVTKILQRGEKFSNNLLNKESKQIKMIGDKLQKEVVTAVNDNIGPVPAMLAIFSGRLDEEGRDYLMSTRINYKKYLDTAEAVLDLNNAMLKMHNNIYSIIK